PIFEALSYTWADSTGNADICMPVYMGPYWQSLPVTRNCWQALRRLRTHGDRLLWVDAICINQQDVLERGHQVPLMRQIYTEASRVVAYLGEKGEDDPKLNLLRTSRRDFDAENRKLLMNKPYFHRLWIIQELKLAYKAV
ncbi:heterokaryon incompatibility, partial [Polyplosphaeria fusca]